jgi:hypothetical protein
MSYDIDKQCMVCSKKPPKTIRVRARHQQHQETEEARLERNRKRREQRLKNRTAKMGDDSDWQGGWEDEEEEDEEEPEEIIEEEEVPSEEEDDDGEEDEDDDEVEGVGASSAMTTAMSDHIATEGNQGAAAAVQGTEDMETIRKQREFENRQKKARAERREENSLPCDGQPVIAVDLYGMALEFQGQRYLFCPRCGHFHTYHVSHFGLDGYRCGMCRSQETPMNAIRHCAQCGAAARGNTMKTADITCLDIDPSDPTFNQYDNPLRCYQTLHMCQKCANSVGLFGRHSTKKLFLNKPKNELWEKISETTGNRMIYYQQKFGH